jgi:hypothetical protein
MVRATRSPSDEQRYFWSNAKPDIGFRGVEPQEKARFSMIGRPHNYVCSGVKDIWSDAKWDISPNNSWS